MKYILVTGGVISGIGKGIISSSVGTLLKSCGFRVTAIKIDPYLNIDAGTFSPYEHGEVFVLDDGGEVDLDLGNYERFLDVTLTSENNITTGKIYQEVIRKERNGDYLGKTVQVVPHITNEIQDWVTKVAKIPIDHTQKEPDVCIIEMGGTIGDIESAPFIEAFRQFQFRVGVHNFFSIHVSLIPCPKSTNEQKSKPTQSSVRELRSLGLSPDIIMCRSEKAISNELKDKLSMFCHVQTNEVISVEDVPTLYQVPLLLYSQKVHEIVMRKLNLTPICVPKKDLYKWKRLCDQDKKSLREVRIVLVGKYVNLEDSYISVYKALNHAALLCNSKLVMQQVNAEHLIGESEKTIDYLEAWKKLTTAMGVIIPGGFGLRGIEGKISAIKFCRENKIPVLGVCLGMQCQVVEFARSVLGWQDAHSAEFDDASTHKVIVEMPDFNPLQKGGTMRLGKRTTFFHTDNALEAAPGGSSVIHQLYNNVKSIEERHRHRFEVNPDLVADFEARGMRFVGRDLEEKRMEILELDEHPYFVGVQFHPEYLSRPNRPSPPYFGLILAATNQLNKKLRISDNRNRNDSFLTDEEDDASLSSYKLHSSGGGGAGGSCVPNGD